MTKYKSDKLQMWQNTNVTKYKWDKNLKDKMQMWKKHKKKTECKYD